MDLRTAKKARHALWEDEWRLGQVNSRLYELVKQSYFLPKIDRTAERSALRASRGTLRYVPRAKNFEDWIISTIGALPIGRRTSTGSPEAD